MSQEQVLYNAHLGLPDWQLLSIIIHPILEYDEE
jgi:hypothetical protein